MGETVRVLIPKSSSGRALVAVENGSRILRKEWVKTSGTSDTEYRFEVTEEMSPNCYLFITLLQPHAQTGNDLPVRLYGVKNISVEERSSRLEPIIRCPTCSPEKEFSSVSENRGEERPHPAPRRGITDLTSSRPQLLMSSLPASTLCTDPFDRVLGANAG